MDRAYDDGKESLDISVLPLDQVGGWVVDRGEFLVNAHAMAYLLHECTYELGAIVGDNVYYFHDYYTNKRAIFLPSSWAGNLVLALNHRYLCIFTKLLIFYISSW